MVSTPCNYIQVAFAPPVVIFLVFLIHLMPIGGEEIEEAEFNFVAAGDWGCEHEAVHTFSMMKSMEPELYLGLGDYSYQNSIDCWVDIVKSAGNAFKIALGNHDTENKLLQAYMDEFKLEKQYYSFNYRNVHFVALSTELNKDQVKQQFNLLETIS